MSNYTITTSYGTWGQHCGLGAVNLEADVEMALGEWVSHFDVEAICTEYRDAINSTLPEGVDLVGDQFIGPADPTGHDLEGLDIGELIDSIDLDAIVARHDTDTE